jgi:flagellar basal-body rod modification protein FlgD
MTTIDTQSTNGVHALGSEGAAPTDAELDRDAFMQLLVAQLRNQDPTSPMDTTQMVQQLTELTSVEHLIGIENRLGSLQVAAASSANAEVAGFTGQRVTADTSYLRLGDVGEATGAFELSAPASQVDVVLYDAEGRIVRRLELGAQASGANTFRWDGQDGTGTRLDPGRYRAEVTAAGEDGGTVHVTPELSGVVEGVSYERGFPELVVGEHRVLLGDVREIRR